MKTELEKCRATKYAFMGTTFALSAGILCAFLDFQFTKKNKPKRLNNEENKRNRPVSSWTIRRKRK